MILLAAVLTSYVPAAAEQEKSAPARVTTANSGQAKAQIPSAPTPAAPNISNEALVWDKLLTRVRMEADGTGTRESSARIRILADAGVQQMAVLTFTYTASNQQVDIGYVRVRKPDGSVVVTPDYNTQDMPADVTRAAPMYSDIHQKHVAVKGLGVGDTLEYQVTLRILKPEVPGQFWFEYSFEKNVIVLDEQLDLDVPASKGITVASAELPPSVTTVEVRKLYHWASSNLARPDPDAPPKSTLHWKPSVQVTTFTSWEQIGAWYKSLQGPSLTVTPAIQARAAALTKGLATDDEKLHAIFNDVALHTHYVSLSFGIGRYRPQSADDVLSNEYGDCKDKHTLLASLLKAVGIEAWPVLISSSRELDPANPSPAQFDHVITLVQMAGKLLWMDSTEAVAPVGVLFSQLRDKQALAIPTDKPAYLERTPAGLPFPQLAHIQVDAKLSDQGELTGRFTETYHGDAELLIRSAFREVPRSQWQPFVQRFSNSLGFAGEVKDPEASAVEEISQPFRFSFDYTREQYGDWANRRISPPMPPMGWELGPGAKEKKPADEPDLGSPGETIYEATIRLPADWTIYPPDGAHLTEDWAEYRSSYSFKDGIYKAERRLEVKKSKVPLAQWEKYLAFRRTLYDDEVAMATLFGPSDSGGPASSPTIAPSFLPGRDPETRKAMLATLDPLRDAMAVLAADTPPSMLDAAKAAAACQGAVYDAEAKSLNLSPDDPRSLYWAQMLAFVWTCRGWAAESNELGVAEIYLRPAWILSQDRMAGYQLARTLEALGRKTEAAHLYELAGAAGVGNALDDFVYPHYNVAERIRASYEKLTGKELNATALNHGRYEGSLRAELDKETEIHQFTRSTKINGQALFTMAFEASKPAKAYFLSGDETLRPLAAALEAQRFAVPLPTGSKARVLREVRLTCTPYAGCDAYLLLPAAIQIPLSGAPAGPKTIPIQGLPHSDGPSN